ncbi:5625_t:CDS:2, partial [Dentiscutata erythropus]
MWFGVKPRCVTLELTKYYIKRGMFSNERFENTLEAILTTKVETKNANGLALLRYWEFAAIDQKEIGKDSFKVQDAIASNPANKSNAESSSANNLNVESSYTDKSSRPVNKLNSRRLVNELNSRLDDPEIVYRNIFFDTTDLYNYHPAEHEDSKIELQYLFARNLSQPSFVCILQQCVEDNS